MDNQLTCVLCCKQAVGCSAQIPTCADHDREYANEAKQYLPLSKRKVYQRLIAAYERRYEHSYFGTQGIPVNAP